MRELKFRAWQLNEFYYFSIPQDDLEGVLGSAVVTQYTGLKDKKGEEIYEGDVLKYIYYDNFTVSVGMVTWLEGGFFINGDFNEWLCEGYCDEMEIIGNIYEHPDLLGKQQFI